MQIKKITCQGVKSFIEKLKDPSLFTAKEDTPPFDLNEISHKEKHYRIDKKWLKSFSSERRRLRRYDIEGNILLIVFVLLVSTIIVHAVHTVKIQNLYTTGKLESIEFYRTLQQPNNNLTRK